jgi:hypothetical protein
VGTAAACPVVAKSAVAAAQQKASGGRHFEFEVVWLSYSIASV